ncbi:MAG: class I SAM-dependent methyltransferase [Phycisphaerales bacterium]|nr:class I SAM-dependent methyltransferase [Phycisphaerales bacterium]
MSESGYELTRIDGRLSLATPGGDFRPICVDFVDGRIGYRRRAQHPTGALLRAIGPIAKASRGDGEPTAIDATAGLGRDAFLLAWAGWRVIACERNETIAALLADGLRRAAESDDDTLREIVGRITLASDSAQMVIPQYASLASAVYVDPMFPPKSKTALVKKEMRILREVVGDDPDAGEIVTIAREAGLRVVVKRMSDAPPLAEEPARSLSDGAIRFDVYEGRE